MTLAPIDHHDWQRNHSRKFGCQQSMLIDLTTMPIAQRVRRYLRHLSRHVPAAFVQPHRGQPNELPIQGRLATLGC